MTTENKTSFPLCWPAGWPRTATHLVRESKFRGKWNQSTGRAQHSMEKVRRELADELHRLGAQNTILSTNVRLRIDADADQVRGAYKVLVKKHHPDAGGDEELFRRVQTAFEEFERLVAV